LQITSAQDSPGISLTATLQPPWFASSTEVLPALSSGSYTPTCVPDPINGYALNCFGPYLIAQGLGAISFAPFPQAETKSAGYALSGKGAVPADNSQKCDWANSAAYSSGFVAGQNDRKNGKAWGTTPNPYTPADDDPYDRKTWQTGYNYGYDSDTPSLYTQPPPTPLLRPRNASAESAPDLSPQSPRPADAPSCTAPPPAPPPNLPPPARFSPVSKEAIDPNFKSGPTGDASSSQYVRGRAALTYDIGFENEATASLPAAAVVVTDQLDPTKVDLTTLSLGTISFGSNVINLPPGSTNYTTIYTPPGVTNYVVRIQGSLNGSNGLLKWTFQTIDPSTGLPPTDSTVGFLAPDSDGIVGQGSVLFTVAPKAGQTTSAQITNTAKVVFDANAAIQTPAWLNTLDVDAPVSSVAPLPANETSVTFAVSWSGTDKGSGIVSYNVYVSDNGGAYTLWQNGATVGSASYTGVSGHSYSFYSEATDGAGNVEAAKTAADTSTVVTIGTPPLTATATVLMSSSTSISQGTAVTVTAAVTPTSGSGIPTGTVTFVDATTTLGTGALDGTGKATYTTSSLASGTHSITAAYSGDTNYVASTSTAVSVTVTAMPADFGIALAPSSGTVQSGSAVTTTITIAPVNGFNQPVSLACSGAPGNATCSINPASVTQNGMTPSNATLTIQTGIQSSAALHDSSLPGQPAGANGTVALGLLGGGLLGFTLLRAHRRSWWRLQFGVVSVFFVCALVEGCGGSSNAAPNHATPKGTYTITVTATAGNHSHLSNYSLTVQ
jgi:hypothetical protein